MQWIKRKKGENKEGERAEESIVRIQSPAAFFMPVCGFFLGAKLQNIKEGMAWLL